MTDRLTRAELARENEAAHVALDALGVDRGDAYRAQLQSVTADRDFYEAVVTEAHEALDLWQGIDENHGVPERINIVRRHEALAGDQMEAAINALVAERDAARQSRARLVGLVRHLRAWFSATAPDSAYVKRITDERDQYITQYTQVKQVAEDARLHISALNELIDDLIAERDAARAWAAAWRRAAIEYRSQVRMFKAAIKDNAWHSEYRRATRAAARRFAETT